MTREEVRDKVIEIVARRLCLDVDKVNEEDSYIMDLGSDEIYCMELIFDFENEFGISIPEEDENLVVYNSVKDTIDYVYRKL